MDGAKGLLESDGNSRNFGSLGGLMRSWNGPMKVGAIEENYPPARPFAHGALKAPPSVATTTGSPAWHCRGFQGNLCVISTLMGRGL